MKVSKTAAAAVALVLVLVQIFSSNLKSFSFSGWDDILSEEEDAYQRRQNVLQAEDYDIQEGNSTQDGKPSDIPKETPQQPKEDTGTLVEPPKETIPPQKEPTAPPSTSVQVVPSTGAFTCDSSTATECCATWDVSADEWWTQHPHWQIKEETADHYCFEPIPDEEERRFLLEVHKLQWNGTNCDQLLKSVEQNSGFGASTDWMVQSFYHATQEKGRPFQVAHNLRPWLYSVDDPDHWGFCEERDSRCFYLPISACTNRTETVKDEHYGTRVRADMKYYWSRQYLFRPRHVFRRKLWEMRDSLKLKTPCTSMHVRRADAGFPRRPFRRYAAVQEYIEAVPNLKKGDNIFLMTDDQTTIDEVHKYLWDDYQWVYLDRPRNRGIDGGWDGHIPSGDAAFEMLAIDTELRLAKLCNQLVHGKSGFMNNLAREMSMDGHQYSQYHVSTSVSEKETREKFGGKPKERVQSFFRDIADYYLKRDIPPHGVVTSWKGDLLPPNDVEIQGTEQLVTCTSDPEQCCGTWDVNADAWWLHKPDWQVSMENETHFCFTPLANETQRDFLRNLHEFQWGGDCKDVAKTVVVNSGFGASIGWNTVTFFYAWREHKQFQLIDHGRHWLYATHNKSSWAYCESADTRCYYLPVSRCSREETIKGEHHDETTQTR